MKTRGFDDSKQGGEPITNQEILGKMTIEPGELQI
jgi:hypothetical protein